MSSGLLNAVILILLHPGSTVVGVVRLAVTSVEGYQSRVLVPRWRCRLRRSPGSHLS